MQALQPSLVRAPLAQFTTREMDEVLRASHTLAAVQFGYPEDTHVQDPRVVRIPLPLLNHSRPIEYFSVDGTVECVTDGPVRFTHGGGWAFIVIEVDEADFPDIEAAAYAIYTTLRHFLPQQKPYLHVQRFWNYIDRITEGEGDNERYKHFCAGRGRALAGLFAEGFPAATCIGYPKPTGKVSMYCLATTQPGTRIENPRQINAWQYPRQYGRISPSFARAMRLPANDALSISGTAAITGHESQHVDDLHAQLDEIRNNINALLVTADMPRDLDDKAPLKIYVKYPEDADKISTYMQQHLSDTPYILLQGDICRRELLVEIEGWCYNQRAMD